MFFQICHYVSGYFNNSQNSDEFSDILGPPWSPGGAESHGGGSDGPPTRQHAGRGGAMT